MDKNEALETLGTYLREHGEQYGIRSLGLFGSTARGDAVENSDVDIVVTLSRPNLMTLSRIRIDLEERLGRPVEIVSFRERMNPFLRERIEREGCYV